MEVLQVHLWRRVDSGHGWTERRCPAWSLPRALQWSNGRDPRASRGEHVQNACLDGQHPLSTLPMHGQFLSCKSEASLSQPPLQLGYRPVMQALALSQNREPLDGGGNEGWK